MEDGCGCLAIGFGILVVMILAGYFLLFYWQVLLLLLSLGLIVWIIIVFHEEMRETILAVGRGIESVLGWTVFEISKITTPEQKGESLMMKERMSLEELKNRSVVWNENVLRENFEYISRQADAPILVKGYFDFLGKQFDLTRRTKLSEERNRWLQTEIVKYRNLQELLEVRGNIDLFPLEHENRKLRLQLEQQQLRSSFLIEDDEKQIQGLQNKRRMKEEELAIAQFDKLQQDLFKGTDGGKIEEKPLSREEARQQKIKELNERINEAYQDIKAYQDNENLSQEDKMRNINALRNIVNELEEQLRNLRYRV